MNLEICANNDWWRLFMTAIELDDDRIDQLIDAAMTRLERAGHTVEESRGERATCHGWKDANTFRYYGCGLGTFDDVPEADFDAACGIIVELIAEIEAEAVKDTVREALDQMSADAALAFLRDLSAEIEAKANATN